MSEFSGLDLPGWEHAYTGKVRELFVPVVDPNHDATLEGEPHVLIVATDRVSAFDHVLDPAIPGKGELLTRLSLWWFAELAEVPNHLVAPGDEVTPVPEAIASRSMLCKVLEMLPIECVVRGYLAGSGWSEYQRTGSVCGVPLPEGLQFGDRLPEPIFTPAWKAPQGEHDENITYERAVELAGEDEAAELRDLSLHIYRRAAAIAEERGLILADTKFEFGIDPVSGVTRLGDEVLTSDSSRYWDAESWHAGNRRDSFDKQIVRNWLAENWDTSSDTPPPALPQDVVELTAARYRELITRLTGE
jgi:phosphoribosylaminoimidazole-succinocarboxamide synthase